MTLSKNQDKPGYGPKHFPVDKHTGGSEDGLDLGLGQKSNGQRSTNYPVSHPGPGERPRGAPVTGQNERGTVLNSSSATPKIKNVSAPKNRKVNP